MSLSSGRDLGELLCRLQLLGADQQQQLLRELVSRHASAKELARELVRLGWLTTFQVNQLFQNNGVGLVLGQYLLIERLGEGGMGTVYKGRHRRLDRLVAVKVIRKELLALGQAVQRFQREVKAAARLSHPNVVLIHDADEEAGTHFCVMEYVEGIDLASLIKRHGALLPAQAVSHVVQAANGLQHIHEQGMVHRDIKPHNLLLTADGKLVKVLDLGLALLDQPDAKQRALTKVGTVMGTADYIAPEQVLDAHKVDIRADIYSLGATLYHLLAGKPPFDGGNVTQKLAWHLQAEPPMLESVRPGIAPELARVVRRMMAKKPADRYQAPVEVMAALSPAPRAMPVARIVGQPSLASMPTVAYQPESGTQLLPPRPRHRRFILIAVLLLVIGVGAVVLPPLFRPDVADDNKPPIVQGTPPSDSPAAEHLARARRYRERGLRRPAQRELEKVIDLDARLAVEARSLLKQWNEDIEPSLPTVDEYVARAEGFISRGKYARAIDDLDRALDKEAARWQTWTRRAHCFEQLQEKLLALDDYRKALNVAPDDRKHPIHQSMANLHFALGDYESSVISFKAALRHVDKDKWLWKGLGDACVNCRAPRSDEALDACKKALDLDDRFAPAWGLKGVALTQKGQYTEALEALAEAIKLDPKEPWNYIQRCRTRRLIPDLKGALEDCEEALKGPTKLPEAYIERALVNGDRAKEENQPALYKASLEDFKEALRLRPNDVFALRCRALIHEKHREYASAITDYSQILQQNPDVWLLERRAYCYEQMGEKGRADEDRQRANKLKSTP